MILWFNRKECITNDYSETVHLVLRKNETKGRRLAYLCNQVYLEESQEGRVGLQQHTCVESRNIGGQGSYETSQKNKTKDVSQTTYFPYYTNLDMGSALPNHALPLLHLQEVMTVIFNRHFFFVFFSFFCFS